MKSKRALKKLAILLALLLLLSPLVFFTFMFLGNKYLTSFSVNYVEGNTVKLDLDKYSVHTHQEASENETDRNIIEIEKFPNSKSLKTKLDTLFPLGTDREFVETVLMDKTHLSASGHFNSENYRSSADGSYFVVYHDNSPVTHDLFNPAASGLRAAQFQYDSAHKVLSIRTHFFTGKNGVPFFIGDPINRGELPTER